MEAASRRSPTIAGHSAQAKMAPCLMGIASPPGFPWNVPSLFLSPAEGCVGPIWPVGA